MMTRLPNALKPQLTFVGEARVETRRNGGVR
jgi:hypothetical protein